MYIFLRSSLPCICYILTQISAEHFHFRNVSQKRLPQGKHTFKPPSRSQWRDTSYKRAPARLPAPVVNYSAVFASPCPFVELAIWHSSICHYRVVPLLFNPLSETANKQQEKGVRVKSWWQTPLLTLPPGFLCIAQGGLSERGATCSSLLGPEANLNLF